MPPCPPWCQGECDLRRARALGHYGETTEIKLSRGALPDPFDFLTLTLWGDVGDEPSIAIGDGNAIADLSIDEAEQMAAILTSFVARARG